MSRQTVSHQKRLAKILRFCLAPGCRIISQTGRDEGVCQIVSGSKTLKPCKLPDIEELESAGLIENRNREYQTTSAGKMHLRRLLAGVDEFLQQHRLPGKRIVVSNGKNVAHNTNEGESPLARLRFRRVKSGKAYIDDDAFQAGERLRADFTKGQLSQRLTSNWSVTENEGAGSNGRNGIGDLTDNALAARNRTQKAIASVGPELAGVLIDVCCFLKGLELVEKERQWPPRSAKLMLKTGLSILARHYGISGNAEVSGKSAAVRHWGTNNFKPEMFPQTQADS